MEVGAPTYNRRPRLEGSPRRWPRVVRDVQISAHPRPGWLRIDVLKEGDGRGEDTLGVCGYSADDTPVTSFTLLGPKERTAYVEILDDSPVAYVKVTEPFFDDRKLARTALHCFRIFYGVPVDCVPNTECGCEFELGAAWRWFEAVEVEAMFFGPPDAKD